MSCPTAGFSFAEFHADGGEKPVWKRRFDAAVSLRIVE